MTIEPGTWNAFTIYIGATFNPSIIWTADGVPVDLTGYTADMQVRTTADAPTIILELSTTDGSIVIDGPAGKLSLLVTATDTALLDPAIAAYDIQLTAPGNTEVDYLLQGTLKIQLMVTR